MRILGIDLGDKRTGLATSDEREILASPYAVLTVRGLNDAVRQISALVEKEKIEKLVVGLPLHFDGTSGARAQRAEAFCEMLRASVAPRPVVLWDERCSTTEAYDLMHAVGKNEKQGKKNVDAVAATLILQSYLDEAGGACTDGAEEKEK